MYLLDTSHCSRLIFGESNLIQQLQRHSEAGVATSAIVQGELFYMAAKSERTVANLQQIRAFLDTIDLYPINSSIAEVYGSLKGKLVTIFDPKDTAQRRNFSPSRLGLGDHDLWIAATAIHYRLTVVSADSDFQRIKAAEAFAVESWV